MANNEYPDKVECPLVGNEIDAGDCLENRDIVEEAITPNAPPDFTKNRDWKGTCRACKWHDVY